MILDKANALKLEEFQLKQSHPAFNIRWLKPAVGVVKVNFDASA